MATLTIRNVDPQVHQRLRERAAGNGRSVEAELRQILNDVVAREDSDMNLAQFLHAEFRRVGGADLALPERVEMVDRVSFE